MRSFKRIGLVVAVGIFATGGALLITIPPRDSIHYHLERLGSLRQQLAAPWPTSVTDYFRPRTWAWYFHGRPSRPDNLKAIAEHEQALIRLGYFEQQEFTLHHRILDAHFWSEYRSEVSKAALADRLWLFHIDDSRPTVLRITACRAYLPTFERIIAQIDRAESQ